MTLSDYELRVLRDLETQLQAPKPTLRARAATLWCTYERAVITGVLAAIMIVGVFVIGVAVAPVAGVLCAAAGYQAAVATQDRRQPRRR